ncbi:MAG: Ada metal-binding domain-containing protein [Thermoleophilia bacterium]
MLNPDDAYAALRARDARFDGVFVVGVTSTGIYCRPSCPTPVQPNRANVTFHRSAAAAQRAGLRACKRCRPDASAGSPEWHTRSDLVGRAMRLIGDGTVDREGVDGLARRLAVSTRHLTRLLTDDVGAGPLALARAQRPTARLLGESTRLPFAEIALAAGFRSVRQFNDTVRQVYALTPTQLRHSARPAEEAGAITVRLAARAPFDREVLMSYLARHATPGVHHVDGGAHVRAMRLPGGAAVARCTPGDHHVDVSLWMERVADTATAVARLRALFDLDADPVEIDAHLGRDAHMAPLVATRPGVRVAGAVDPHEVAIWAVLSQQVSVAAASTAAGRLAAAYGDPLPEPRGGVERLFPTATRLAELDPADLPMPRSRGRALVALAGALAGGGIHLGPGADRDEARRRLIEIPGIGPWTAEVIAMRTGDPDAFFPTDLVLRRRAAELGITDLTGAARQWSPWRAYALTHVMAQERAAASTA